MTVHPLADLDIICPGCDGKLRCGPECICPLCWQPHYGLHITDALTAWRNLSDLMTLLNTSRVQWGWAIGIAPHDRRYYSLELVKAPVFVEVDRSHRDSQYVVTAYTGKEPDVRMLQQVGTWTAQDALNAIQSFLTLEP